MWKERRDGNVLFNNALNTFYLRLYGIRHMVNDHSDNERGNLLYCVYMVKVQLDSENGNLLTTVHGLLFVTPIGEHFLV